MIRVLVVDDSPTALEVIAGILEADPEIEVVGRAADGPQAVEMAAELKPDLITMDVVMPGMDGLETTKVIMEQNPASILMVTASETWLETDKSFEAVKAGALDVIGKPTIAGADRDQDVSAQDLIEKVKSLSGRSLPNQSEDQ